MTPEELMEKLEGTMPAFAKAGGRLRCDVCFTGIDTPTEIGLYASNVDVRTETRRDLRVNMMFCEECNPHHIRLPHTGYTEIHLTVDLVDEGGTPMWENPRIDQTSKSQNGTIWNPKDVWEEIADIPVPSPGPDSAATAAHISEVLTNAGVPLEDLIQEDGSLDFTGYSRPELRERVEQYMVDAVGAEM